ncbi:MULTISPECIES: formyltetrahydrofolate deformylase [unclassified Sphingomonas]|uniref:formyltetrahydrofolate deformylase n=1 Tax=unclassified Sphingomonas TaxID=196159 RepID=UPI0006FBFECC|nr:MULTISPECIES: formyltetrahydrofolate deformylase [unclassified Sphingomonas]KQX25992.1 formyltetrahydrofolate deformylase [Sphingomonas sp. Root1294]KQY69058.1 formyltetrahydrofolate deformylase [Sphingomonas sp. Root50]KRB89312.1 formyltetrahydrofolate deformylase [Sphingomonas sp. Root720]
MTQVDSIIFTLACPDTPGIVAGVSNYIFEGGYNIIEAGQFTDSSTGKFFMRIECGATGEAQGFDAFSTGFAPLADKWHMDWKMRPATRKTRVMLLVSKFHHCLSDLIYRWRTGELDMDIVGIVSNHPAETFASIDLSGIPFHHLPVTRATRTEQEERILSLVQDSGTDLVVLARYMQILSDDMSARLSGKCINIHHSFLPSFKGAKPYHQAFDRGVKVIGATAHYVTSDLDEGPIIHQDIEAISHANSPDDLIRKGRDIERLVLSRAVQFHLEDRVILNGTKTVVFAK